jgi:hypothetical protein
MASDLAFHDAVSRKVGAAVGLKPFGGLAEDYALDRNGFGSRRSGERGEKESCCQQQSQNRQSGVCEER